MMERLCEKHILGHTRRDTTDRYLRSLAPDVLEAVSVLDEVIDVEKMSERKKARVITFSRR